MRKRRGDTNFASDTTLELYGGIVVDELEVLQDLYALLIVGDKLEILIRYGQFEVGDVRSQNLFGVYSGVLYTGY